VYEQLAQGCYRTMEQPGVEPANHSNALPISIDIRLIKVTSRNTNSFSFVHLPYEKNETI